MEQVFRIGERGILRAKEENIKGVLLDIDSKKTDGSISPITDFTDIDVSMAYKQRNGNVVYLFNGNLEEYLTALYGNTMKYYVCKKALAQGYKVDLNLLGTLSVAKGEEFIFEIDAKTSAFTSVSKVESSITVETIPSVLNYSTVLPIIEKSVIGAGNVNYTENVGNNVHSLILATDYDTKLDASTKAKVKDVQITAIGNYNKNVSQNLLVAENMTQLNDVQQDVKNLVLYKASSEEEILHGVNVKLNLDKQADTTATLLIVRAIQF